MKYYIFLDNYKTNYSSMLDSFTDKYNSLFYVDSWIQNFLELHQGNLDINSKIFKNKHDFKNNDEKYIVVKKNSQDKFYIYKKKIEKGIIFNKYNYEKIYSISIIVKYDNRNILPIYDSRGYIDDDIEHIYNDDIAELKEKYNEVIAELKEKFSNKNIDTEYTIKYNV